MVSPTHQALVKLLSEWCEDRADNHKHLVLKDCEELGNQNPPSIGGYRPDLVWIAGTGDYRFIGEAKTRDDINNSHTRSQLAAYLNVINSQEYGDLIVAVPWGYEGVAISILVHIDRGHGSNERRWTVISNHPTKTKTGNG